MNKGGEIYCEKQQEAFVKNRMAGIKMISNLMNCDIIAITASNRVNFLWRCADYRENFILRRTWKCH